MEFLLNTGATVNTISWKRFNKLENLELNNTDDTLRCANHSTLETIGKAVVEV